LLASGYLTIKRVDFDKAAEHSAAHTLNSFDRLSKEAWRMRIKWEAGKFDNEGLEVICRSKDFAFIKDLIQRQ
jgi:hypothetical protein